MPEDVREKPAASGQRKALKPPRLTREATWNAALHYLERFDSSAENVRRMLERRIFRAVQRGAEIDEAEARDAIDAALKRLQELGYIADDRYAEHRIRSLRRAGRSDRYIRGWLSARGVQAGIIDQMFASLAEEEQEDDISPELEAARRYARKRRFGPWCPDPEKRQAEWKKHYAALARQGFPSGIVRQVLEEDLPD